MFKMESTAENKEIFIANCKMLWDNLARHVELHGSKEAQIRGFCSGPVIPFGTTGLTIEINMITPEPKLRIIKT